MENRRNFFKAIGLFVGGAIASKVSAMVPKEEKEELKKVSFFEKLSRSKKKGKKNIDLSQKKEKLKKNFLLILLLLLFLTTRT